MNTDLTNTITKGSKILNPRNSIGIVTNEDRCVVGVVLSVSGNLVTFRKIWDTEETKVFNARIFVPGIVTPEDSPNVEVDEIMPFFRVGDYNSSGDEAFEKHAENASNFSWIGFIQPAAAYEISDYYVLKDDSVQSSWFHDYWIANVYNVSSDVIPYNYNRVKMYRNKDSGKPGYCVSSRNNYSTWKAKYYTAYDESTKTYSGLYFTQDAVFVSSLWSYDVILPRVGTGVANKLSLVPNGFHPFDVIKDKECQACYLKIEEKNTSDYSSTATRDSGTYLYDNSIDLTTILVPGEVVTINTTPVQVRTIDVVYSDHISFTDALTTAITTGTTFTVDFVNRETWIYLSTRPIRFFWPGNVGKFWPLNLGNSASSGDWYYRYATHGCEGVCEESEELVCAAGAENINGTLYGGPIPDTNWEFPGIGNLASSYTKAISYDYTYKALYGGGGVKISRLASDWKIWDRFATPPAWRNAVAGNTVQSVYIWEIWEGKQRQSLAYFSLTLI